MRPYEPIWVHTLIVIPASPSGMMTIIVSLSAVNRVALFGSCTKETPPHQQQQHHQQQQQRHQQHQQHLQRQQHQQQQQQQQRQQQQQQQQGRRIKVTLGMTHKKPGKLALSLTLGPHLFARKANTSQNSSVYASIERPHPMTSTTLTSTSSVTLARRATRVCW
jgi:hemolysin activation/secretion protein